MRLRILRTEYGFLADVRGVLVDCEPAPWNGSAYETEGAPAGSCPPEPEGNLGDRPIRCNSWEAILWDYFYYMAAVAQSQWRAKDHLSYHLARSAYGEKRADLLHTRFESENGARPG